MIILTVPHNINKYCLKVVRVCHNNQILKDSDIKGPEKCAIRCGIVENGKKRSYCHFPSVFFDENLRPE